MSRTLSSCQRAYDNMTLGQYEYDEDDEDHDDMGEDYGDYGDDGRDDNAQID